METECSTKIRLPPDESINQKLDLFFANGLYSSCQATDELMKSIAESRDETLARKALALYQRQYSFNSERHRDNVTCIYGLGLIYMHFNAYHWAIKAFREVIYLHPNFPKARDVHTRLGLIFKATGRFKLSEKHFNLAIYDTRPDSGTSTNLELKFHLAHLSEIQGKFKQAKEAYERLLQQNDLPQQLSANIHRQLGCMYFYNDVDSQASNKNADNQSNFHRKQNMFNNNQHSMSDADASRIDSALNYLSASYRTGNDPISSYYLGRCFTNIGKFQDAFASYRSVIDREESTADTWCSIGVLYHRQNQPSDALQAYIRSVQFDKHHSVSWMNLGILYESHNQFRDALKCYRHMLRSNPSNGIDQSLLARIRYIQKQMEEIETSSSNNGRSKVNSDKLLSLEDLWNLESKTNSESSDNSNNCKSAIESRVQTKVSDSSSIKATHCPPHQQQHQQQSNMVSHRNSNSRGTSPVMMEVDHHNSTDPYNRNDHQLASQGSSNTSSLFNNNTNNTNNNHICANTMKTPHEADSKSKSILDANQLPPSTLTGNHIGLLNDFKLNSASTHGSQEIKPQPLDSKDFCLNQVLTNGASKDSGISSNSSTYADCALVPSQCLNFNTVDHIFAEQVIEACRNSQRPRKIDINLVTDKEKPPRMFPKCPPYPPLKSDKLFPSPPSIFLETKKDLTAKKLQDCCQSSLISIVRNIASVLKLDLGLFSTKTLIETDPDHQVDIISYLHHQASSSANGSEGLNCESKPWASDCQRSKSTISRYASYQVASFRESLQEERESRPSTGLKASLNKESETDSNESASNAQAKKLINNNNNQSTSQQSSANTNGNHNDSHLPNSNIAQSAARCGQPPNHKLKKEQTKAKQVKSAENIDLSDDKKWRIQLNELNKLPNFMKCVSASNMLTHVGFPLPGINTIAMSMHVPGCRILGNKTADNFCSININVGPGDYEWWAVSVEYESILNRLCNRNGFELDEPGWWPRISDLQKHNIPIYRFSQRPGDLVWINSATIYGIQSTGWCNNIHWNVGPLCAQQYKSASYSYELNKFLYRKSEVPMIQLTWNVIININIIPDDELYSSIVDTLRRSLKYCALIEDIIEEAKKTIQLNSDEPPGPRRAKYCSLCECEVFNITFSSRKSDVTDLHCFECARRADPSFENYEIKREYDLKYLMKLYDNLIETKKKFQSRKVFED